MGILTGLTTAAAGVIGSGITGASGIGSSIASNVVNRKIAQMNNEFNERMLDKQIAYNKQAYQQQLSDTWDMYHYNNAYNSPEQQVQRLRDAGLNPHLAVNGSNTASVSSTPSQQGINPPTATSYSADYSGIAAALAQSMDILTNLEMKQAQASQIKIDNSYRATEAKLRIAEKYLDIDGKKFDNLAAKEIHAMNKRMHNADLDLKYGQQELQRMELSIKNGQILEQNIRLQYLPDSLKEQLNQAVTTTEMLKKENKLKGKALDEAAQRIAGIILDNEAKRANNEESSKTYHLRYNKAVAELKKAMVNTGPNLLGGVGDTAFAVFDAIASLLGKRNVKPNTTYLQY